MNIKVFESLAELPESISQQCSYPVVDDFFSSFDWFSCLYDAALRHSLKPRIYCSLDDDGNAVGILFCGVEEGKRTLHSLTNFYTMTFAPNPLSAGSGSDYVLDVIVKFIQSERPRWNAIDFRYLLDTSESTSQLSASFEDRGFHVTSFFMYQNWFLNVDGMDFETYYSNRSSRLRNTIKRKEKKLEKSHKYHIQIHTQPGESTRKAAEDYVAIYNKSWKRPEPFPTFIPQLVEAASSLGILRLGVLYIDDKPAASQLWITTRSKTLIYKLAYDDEYSIFSAGSILSREMFKYALDNDAVKEIDYGVGSENYKKDWMESVRDICGFQAYNKYTVKGLALTAMEVAKSLARSLRNRRK